MDDSALVKSPGENSLCKIGHSMKNKILKWNFYWNLTDNPIVNIWKLNKNALFVALFAFRIGCAQKLTSLLLLEFSIN